jgi:DNA-binding IclR family transcriptional regulator
MTDKGVAAVDRALSILECFGADQESLSLKELADRTGLYKSTILRLAVSLEAFGYMRRREDGRYQLGPTLWRLGTRYRNQFDMAGHMRPVLKQLAEQTGESASYYVRDGDARICLVRQNSTQAIRHHLEEGTRLPLTHGAASHLIRAYTEPGAPDAEPIRNRGFTVSLGERDPDTASIAVPITGGSGAFLGALVVSGLRSRFDEPARDEAIQLAKAAAGNLSGSIAL